ncbi:hypothetical protein V8C26DRAFT_414172 [Trichoderma gracile]
MSLCRRHVWRAENGLARFRPPSRSSITLQYFKCELGTKGPYFRVFAILLLWYTTFGNTLALDNVPRSNLVMYPKPIHHLYVFRYSNTFLNLPMVLFTGALDVSTLSDRRTRRWK